MRNFANRRTMLCAAVAAGLAAMGLGAQAQTVEMKLGFVTINDSQHEGAKLFAEEIAKKTGGAIQVKIFPAGQLGNIARQIEGLQLGTQEAFMTPPGFMVGISPAFQAADAAGLFDSPWHHHKTLNHPPVRDRLLTLPEKANITGVYLWSAGNTGIASREPINKLEDIKGLKLRVLASKVEIGVVASFGATGIPMDFTEVIAAIQNRTLDGTRIGVVVLAPSKFYTVAKHIYAESTGYVPAGMWVSKGWIDKLPANLRQAIHEVGQGIADRTELIAIDLLAKGAKIWRDNGGTIVEPTPADKAEMLRRARAVSDEILGNDPAVKEVYALVKAGAAATAGMKPPTQ
ncbi:MAG: TRAP transporter substrate-binding protein [Rhodospirillales bacterium]